MDNANIAQVMLQLQLATRSPNPSFSKAIERAILSVLDSKQSVALMNREQLLHLKGFNQNNVDLLLRAIGGESIESVISHLPPASKKPPKERGVTGSQNIYSEWKRVMKY